MGLFSGSEKVYSGGVVLTPLFDKKPNVIRETIAQSILQDSSMTEDLISIHLNGFNSKAARYLSYGKRFYTNGLPEGDKSYGVVNTTRIKEVLDKVIGEPVTIRYAQVSEPEYIRYAAEYCQKKYGWSYVTGELLNPPAGVKPVRIASATNNGTTLSITLSHKPRVSYVSVYSPPDFSRNYNIYTRVPVVTYSYFTLTVPLDISGLSYHVEYTLDSDLSNPQKILLWNYSANSHEYPELSDVSSYKYESQYYPVVPFRRNRRNLVDSPSDPLNITGNKMLKKVGLSMKTLTDGISNGNNIKDVDEAFFLFALNIDTQLPEGKEYLFKYWKQEADENTKLFLGDSQHLLNKFISATESTKIPDSVTISIKDGEFNTTIKYSGITKYITKNRTIGKINTVKLTKVILPNGVIKTKSTLGFFHEVSTYYERSYIILEKQISSTETETVKVFGLEHETVIAGVTQWTVKSTLSSGKFYIPVSYDIVRTFSGIDESKILMESMSVLIYWTNVTKVKTGGFFGKILGNKILMIIIIVVVTIISQGGMTAMMQQLAAMSATQVLQAIAISVAVSYGLKKLGEMGGIFAVIAAVAAMYYFKVGTFAQNSATLAEPTWAESLLNAVTMISKEFTNIIARDMKDLMEDVGDFLKTSQDKTEELEKAHDLLDNSTENAFDPFFILRQGNYFNPNETPSAFFSRTLNTNPGVASLDYTSVYVQSSLELPEFNGLNEVTTHNEYAYNG